MACIDADKVYEPNPQIGPPPNHQCTCHIPTHKYEVHTDSIPRLSQFANSCLVVIEAPTIPASCGKRAEKFFVRCALYAASLSCVGLIGSRTTLSMPNTAISDQQQQLDYTSSSRLNLVRRTKFCFMLRTTVRYHPCQPQPKLLSLKCRRRSSAELRILPSAVSWLLYSKESLEIEASSHFESKEKKAMQGCVANLPTSRLPPPPKAKAKLDLSVTMGGLILVEGV